MSGLPFQEIMQREAEKAIKQNLGAILESLKRGDFSGFQIPSAPAPIQTPAEVRQDARDRGLRTFIQQFSIDLGIALATVIGPLLLSLDVSNREQWIFIGLSVLKTIVSTLVAYMFRIFYAPREESQISLAEAKRVA